MRSVLAGTICIEEFLSKKLFIASTPIGNLSDVSSRFISLMKSQSLFFAEDTRNLIKLLKLLDVDLQDKDIRAFHEHNQEHIDSQLDLLEARGSGVLVSDAGSPLLSDPGYPLVKGWIDRGGTVESIPGPSSITVALEVSGLPPMPFMFHGFLPRKTEAIKNFISSSLSDVTHLVFESPNRISKTLEAFIDVIPNGQISLVRELTKLHETHYRGTPQEVLDIIGRDGVKGEVVLLFRHDQDFKKPSNLEELATSYLSKPSPKSLAKLLGEITGEKTKKIYETLNK